MDAILDLLEYESLDRVWIERRETTVREGRETVTRSVSELHVVRSTESGAPHQKLRIGPFRFGCRVARSEQILYVRRSQSGVATPIEETAIDGPQISETIDRVGGRRSVVATLSGYALSPADGRLPVLPVVVELYRHGPDWPPAALRATREADTWRLVVKFGDESVPSGLSNAPIESA
jgi:hypothetical protein